MSHDDWALTLTGLAALATTILAVLGLMNSRQLSHVIRLARRELAFSRRPVVCVQTGEPDVEHGSLRLPATFRETSGHPARLHQLNVRVEAPEIEPPEIGPQELTVSHVRHDLLYELTEEVDRRLDEVRRHDLWVRVPRRLLNGHDAVDVVFTYAFSHDHIRRPRETWEARKPLGIDPETQAITRSDVDPIHSFCCSDIDEQRET